ncbi:MAG TPA: glycosyltransferase family 2 protein [Acidimicrobiales bacterium]|nr:glycosyltransferase family 2 protein [Acidimicrobiales bacterium]
MIVVLGMQASGVGDVAAEVRRLGVVPRNDATDRTADLCRRALLRLGGNAERPPSLGPGWELDEDLDDLAADVRAAADAGPGDARAASRGPTTTAAALFADPALSLLLPLWRRAVARPVATVLVTRDPAEIAGAIAGGDTRRIVAVLARYERYMRSALSALDATAVHVARHEDLVDDPAAFSKGIARFLEDAGLVCSAGAAVAPRGAPERSADPAAATLAASLLLPEHRHLASLLAGLAGTHTRFAPGDPGPPSPWSASLVDLESDLDHVFAGLLWATRQLEPLVRMTPSTTGRESPGAAERDDPPDDSLEAREPEDDGPYPLNASEDRRAYHRWLAARRLPVIVGGAEDPPLRRAATRAPLRRGAPLVSFVVPVWQTPLWVLERCVGSVLSQSSPDWELCMCDDASGDPELASYLRSLERVDRRIRTTTLAENGGISAASNAALGLAAGRFIGFLDHDDELTRDALATFAAAIADAPDGDVLYSDEDKIDASGERFDPLFKPDWSPDLLLSFQYLGHLTLVRRELVKELGGLRSDYDGSQDYDLVLRATERARRVVHVPEVLYHWRSLPGSAASDSSGVLAKPWAYEAGLRAIEDAMNRRGEPAEVAKEPRFAGRYHVRRALQGHPLVSVVIPFRDEPALLATCCESLLADPGYDRVELMLVDNGSELPETAALLDRLSLGDHVRIISSPGPFNWAKLNNLAVREASGEVLLFSNNDIEARAPRWLHAMLGHAQRTDVGAVGARLVYPDGAIQHAGVVVGLGGIAGHVLRGLPGEHPGYNSMAFQTRDCSVVTGACMMTRREVFDSVGGFDEDLPVAFNDVDFCLKLRERELLVVYTPLAELVHHESRSRGHTDDLVESRRILERWAHVIEAGDPYLNRNLSHWRYWCPLSTAQEDDRWKTYLETSVSTRGRSSSTSGSS